MMYFQWVSMCSYSQANLHNRSQVGYQLKCVKVIYVDVMVLYPHFVAHQSNTMRQRLHVRNHLSLPDCKTLVRSPLIFFSCASRRVQRIANTMYQPFQPNPVFCICEITFPAHQSPLLVWVWCAKKPIQWHPVRTFFAGLGKQSVPTRKTQPWGNLRKWTKTA